jgi:hypothetical protein
MSKPKKRTKRKDGRAMNRDAIQGRRVNRFLSLSERWIGILTQADPTAYFERPSSRKPGARTHRTFRNLKRKLRAEAKRPVPAEKHG